ncbi:aminotransferase class III-fold pyridoxal phosphate-dependent enzyme, partial [Siminovitchia fortis]
MCDENEMVLIVDEVMKGFGGRGKMLGWEEYEMVGDVMILGKGMWSG